MNCGTRVSYRIRRRRSRKFSLVPESVGQHAPLDEFLRDEENGRTGISFPTSKPGVVGRLSWQGRLDETQVDRIEERLAEMMAEFGLLRSVNWG